ncbi:uncharacterized protein LOC127368860 isoform X2 [Dicentrarchus labrax]|uniref:uncharacterized protein LOC127368860 isoform X2 n=1 Tax=Dicentrarchus labrax TaxID=13489 RepID=UPI0021F5E41B|nr:uncharacterized protein LOC127368860 isoform X2 [Dicentrarchus labrax]
MYEMIKKLPTHLEIKHTSRKSHTTTHMILDFYPPAASAFCKFKAISTTPLNSRLNGTSPNNYCPFYNLISGSGLTQAEGYKEICNSAMCSSKESATCITKGSRLHS